MNNQQSISTDARWLYGEPRLHSSFGIIDNDYGQNEAKVKDKELKDSIAILERHSLENYVFDPFVFYSALSVEDRGELELPIKLNEFDIKKNLQHISQNKGRIQEKIDNYFEYFNSNQNKPTNVNQNKPTNVNQNKQTNVNQNKPTNVNQNKQTNVNQNKPTNVNQNKPTNVNQNKPTNVNQNKPTNVNQNQQTNEYNTITILTKESKIDFKYPSFFLETKGHCLSECLFEYPINAQKRKQGIEKIMDKIIENISYQNLEAIPFDLAQKLFDLNAKVINIVRVMIGKKELVAPENMEID
jgi:hypothetical protein